VKKIVSFIQVLFSKTPGDGSDLALFAPLFSWCLASIAKSLLNGHLSLGIHKIRDFPVHPSTADKTITGINDPFDQLKKNGDPVSKKKWLSSFRVKLNQQL